MTVWRLPTIPDQERENLRLVCDELELPLEALEWLEPIARGIKYWETMGRDKSVPQRKRELQEVARLSRKLNDALQALEYQDRAAIHQEFKGLQIRMLLDPPDPIREVFCRNTGGSTVDLADVCCENVLLLGDVLLTLAGVSTQVEADLNGPLKGGRPTDLKARVSHLTEVARFAHKHGIPVDRGHRFVRLSEAVFTAAGIKVSPEPVIRVFVAEMLPIMRPIWEKEWASEDDSDSKDSG